MRSCFECDAPASEDHHVVPESLGGRRTIPLCPRCHAKVHGLDGELRTALPALQRAGIAKARAAGKYRRGDVDRYQVATLSRMGYSAAEIAEALKVSTSTVYRCLKGDAIEGIPEISVAGDS